MKDFGLNSVFNIRYVEHRTFLFIYHLVGDALMPFCNSDVPVSLAGHNGNCRNTDASFSIRLRLRVHRRVLLSSIPRFSCTHYYRRLHSRSTVRSLRGLTRATSKLNTFAPTQINRIEVAVDVAYEQHQMSQTKKCTDEQLDDKSHTTSKSGHGSDLESTMENRV
jgi:hypothetical protein